MDNKLTFEQLADWVEGRLPEADAARVAVLVEQNTDAGTKATVAWLRALNQTRAHTALATPSAQARKAALGALSVRKAPGLLRRIQALLTPPRLAPSTRAGLRATPRRLNFAADAYDIVLTVDERPTDGLFDLNGQFFAPDGESTAVTVQLLRDDVERGLTGADALGEFGFSALTPGTYALIVRARDTEIELAPLML
jgi:hypothetical protein